MFTATAKARLPALPARLSSRAGASVWISTCTASASRPGAAPKRNQAARKARPAASADTSHSISSSAMRGPTTVHSAARSLASIVAASMAISLG